MGCSDKPVLEYTPQLHERILRKFIDQLDLHDVILVGLRLDGPIMTRCAIHNPWHVDGLVLVESFA